MAAAMSSSPITQVQQVPTQAALQPPLLTRLSLDLRGKRFSVDRETIMNLPESVLLCLFPNASSSAAKASPFPTAVKTLKRKSCMALTSTQTASPTSSNSSAKPQTTFMAPNPLQASTPLNSPTSKTRPPPNSHPPRTRSSPNKPSSSSARNSEYFSIPPRNGTASTDADGIANDRLLDLKRTCGGYLLEKRNIFTALQRNVNKENNVAEQHLIDMLCMSGFDRDDEWGFRAVEPSRCCISSIALVLLKTGIVHSTAPTGERQVAIDYNQMGTAQKLLLFWRKPARKCWWDGIEMDLPPRSSSGAEGGGGEQPRSVKLWARRVWTLELSLPLYDLKPFVMADFDLEELVHVEQTFYDSGYADGFVHGRIHGLIEGRALGREKGFEMWEEVGFYEGFARTWIALRALHHARHLLELTSRFPRSNPAPSSASADEGTDITALQRQIRSRYKTLCATLGVRASPRAASAGDDNADDEGGAGGGEKRKRSVWKVEGPPVPKREQGLSF
ncbi:hypothetical protein EW146_g7797 [Bondarzewia mesenterica]|uniref:Essential protein Yae1 N-terminal domain-containing protein n=1 Tax=Bondarzewia mesenterica TaxID=1095465 RepID=A0A4V3XE40_9AGAM|nr:hypothetical protein EW146_g7797 [Bondarzewia mesenterica]